MILTCPACATQYRLKDGAIPAGGRQVRCAACKHKWHQDGDAGASGEAGGDGAPGGEQEQREAVAIAPPQPDPSDPAPPVGAISAAAAREGMIAEEPQPDVGTGEHDSGASGMPDARDEGAPAAPWNEPQPAGEEYAFAAIPAMNDEDEPPRRGMLGWIVGIVLFVAVAAAAFWFLAPPELKARAGIAEAGESPLQLMLTTSDRQRLASGNELVAISGRVINSTDREQAVPPIHAELRSPTTNKLVYRWTIAPPARSLGPGQAASFNSAEVDVPAGGESLSLRFAS